MTISSFVLFAADHFPCISSFPASTSLLASFTASLVASRYAPSTIRSYMSALSYLHKISGIPDSTQHFVIKKLLAGAFKLSGKPDIRLPIGRKSSPSNY